MILNGSQGFESVIYNRKHDRLNILVAFVE